MNLRIRDLEILCGALSFAMAVHDGDVSEETHSLTEGGMSDEG